MSRLDPSNLFDNIPPFAVIVSGDLDMAALRTSLDCLVANHEILRTTFDGDDLDAEQCVWTATEHQLLVYDVGGFSTEQVREEAAVDILREEAVRPFDLTRGPLWRAGVVSLGSTRHVIFLTMHHIVTDLWSMRLALHEWASWYSAAAGGAHPVVVPLPFQYADFASRQRQRLAGGSLEATLDHWRKHLAGTGPARLPLDRVRQNTISHDGEVVVGRIAADLHTTVRTIGRREGLTAYMTMLAAFKTTLWSFSGQNELVVGSPTANRTAREVEPLIGHFAHTLAMRTRVDRETTMRDLRLAVRDACCDAHAHADVPFWRIAREFDWGPASIVMFQMQRVPVDLPQFAPLRTTPFHTTGIGLFGPSTVPTRQFDLSCEVWDSGSDYTLVFSYRSDCMKRSTVEEFARRFEAFLRLGLARPGMTLDAAKRRVA